MNRDDKRNELRLHTNKVVHELKGPNFNSGNLNSSLNVEDDIQLNIRNDLVGHENIEVSRIINTEDRQPRSNNMLNYEHVTRRHKARKENLQPKSNIFINPYPEHDQLLTERPGRQHYNETVKNGEVSAINRKTWTSAL